jgi:rod shape-determining protein MreD
MIRVVAYFLLGLLFILVQTALVSRILPFSLKPDLLLILAVYLGLNESYVRGGILAYLLGCLNDVFAGRYLGLYGLALLATFFAVRGVGGRLNTESSTLLLSLVFAGTFLEGSALFFALAFFADAAPPFLAFLQQLLPQALLNVAATLLLIHILPRVQKQVAPRADIPGLRRLNSHES